MSARAQTRLPFAALVVALVAAVGLALAAPEPGGRAGARPYDERGDAREGDVNDGARGGGSNDGGAARESREATRFLPPGASGQDPGPSAVVFPAQSIPLRFDHKKHVKGLGLSCVDCHARAKTSHDAADRLLPAPAVCDDCHGSRHADLDRVTRDASASSRCESCHVGWNEGDGNRVARVSVPAPNLRFDHQKHAARNIACGQCHGAVQELGLATRDQLPRMKGCLGCHQHPDAAARGDAKGECLTCHLAERPSERARGGAAGAGPHAPQTGGRMRTLFAQGKLEPPRWMHDAAHDPDFLKRHKWVAANDSTFCASCHTEDSCVACHDGRVRPRSIHPNDYLALHPVEARLATQRCTSCHREQSFCVGCHQRLGVAMSGPAAGREAGRFHPPKEVWSDAPRRPGHHAQEAMRNLDACVSCHVERDCVVCHGGAGIGGGFNPHRGGFAASCATPLRRNPRPCYVCHEPGAAALELCR